MELTTEKWYVELVEELQGMLVEDFFAYRWAKIKIYHGLAQRISEEHNNFERAKIYGQEILQSLATSLKISLRTLYYALELYRKYPDMEKIPDGKSISMNTLIKKYLPAPKAKEEKEVKPKYNIEIITREWQDRSGNEKDNGKIRTLDWILKLNRHDINAESLKLRFFVKREDTE